MTKDELIDKLDKAFEPLDDDFELARLDAENSRLKQMLADSEAQNKRVLKKLELLVRSNQELEKALELACKVVLDFTGNCPYDQFDLEMPKDCEEQCAEQMKRYFCWDKYFIEQAQKELSKNATQI